MMDENVESCKENNALSHKLSEQKAENDSATNLPVEDSAVISVSVKEEIPTIPKPASAGNADLDFLKMLDQPKPEATGSRFRHLFTKAEQTSPTENTEDINTKLRKLKAEDINTKLRKLKAGVDKAASPSKPLFDKPATGLSQTQPTASELETALRSLLLGKTAAGSVPNISTDTALTRNTAPTVQEIEAAVLHASSDSRSSLGNRDVLQPLCLSSIQDKQTPDRNLTATDTQSWMSTTNADVRPPNLPFDMTPLTTSFAQTQPSRQQLNLLSSLEPRQARDPSVLSKWEEVLSSAAGQKGALNGLLSKMNAAYSTAAERVPGCLPPPPPLYAHCPPFPSTSTNTTALLPPDPAVQPNRRPIVKSFQFIDESGDSRMQNTRSDMPVVPPPPGLPSYNRTHAPLATGITPQSFRGLEAILQWNLKQQQQRQADCRKNFPSGLTASAGGGGPAYSGQSHFAQLESFVSKASASTPGMKPNFNSPELPMRWQNQLPLDNQAGGSFSTTDLFRSVTEVEALANKSL
ncbi:unnamed protein product [Dibothriocephalus latus]|uniref:Uncharacterized protein n=1 Tax=Dibothriocephalus latus TaxID=60516 RepID=A0A3P7NUA9_DIBLA|nr:unnamed protein product [Dibothriocephalus latus]